jgi:hypothetical protein
MAKIIGIVAAVVVFLIWHSLIGNPHVIETIIGLVLAIAGGIWVYSIAKKLGSNN